MPSLLNRRRIVHLLTRLGAGCAFATIVVFMSNPLRAEDACITCTFPNASYRCALKKSDQVEAFAGVHAVEKICLKYFKVAGNHRDCAVSALDQCAGSSIEVKLSDLNSAYEAAREKKRSEDSPSLLDSISNAMKNSWTCVSTFFKSC